MTINERKEREKEKRRNDIIDAAERVFFSQHAAEATMDDIAEKAELSKGTLYLYFKKKEDLVAAIILRGITRFQTMAVEAAESCQTGLEKLSSIADALYRFQKQYPNYFEILFNTPPSISDKDVACLVDGDWMEEHNDMLQFVVSVIQKGIEDGSIRSDIDPYKSALALQGLIIGLIRMVSLEADHLMKCHQISSEEVLNYAFELVGHALKNSTGDGLKCPAKAGN